ncbi:MAG: Mrp/NBP35 family ATP-binding protein [Bacteroidales bacterium]|nr:Mrp/NBP35 family ATP-binding protein [Bacteroidales bacterium]
MAFYPAQVIQALKRVIHPEKGIDIVEMGMLEDDIRISGNRVSFSLLFDRPNDPLISIIKQRATAAIKEEMGPDVEIDDNIFIKIRQRPKAPEKPILPGVKNVIAVASGKGGVGKSTVTANLAIALTKLGYKVGLLDADIFGPSIPIMFNTEDARPTLSEKSTEGNDLIDPIEQYGVKMLSIGFFVDPKQAVVWRGAMATNAIKQLVTEADWGELDYLLIDMPPGTSDIHISLVGLVKLTGAIVVSTPQKVALADARKGCDMFLNPKVDVPVLGIVENMAWFTPAELPENKYYIFGQGGASALAAEIGVPLLGQIPIVQSIRECGDNGSPAALDESSIAGSAFAALAEKVAQICNK